MKLRLVVAGVLFATWAAFAQQGDEQLPRFRAGANLVRVDAYFTVDGVAVTDLKPEDIEVFEDDTLQKLEDVDLVEARGPAAASPRAEPANVAGMQQAVNAASRVFTLFFDTYHVSVGGSYRASKPIVETLDTLIGQDDMVGVMTPEMSPGNITYGRRISSIERFVTETWAWGVKDQVAAYTPREEAILACYPANPEIAEQMIARLREQQTLNALRNLVTHLEDLRPERKFVIVFTEGWPLYQRDENLGRPLGGITPGGPERAGVNPASGRLEVGGADRQSGTSQTREGCDRERVMLSFIDHQIEFRELLQRANRANVSFYPVDARGLIVFDTPPRRGELPSDDRARLDRRYDELRNMAAQTDGVAVLDTNNVGAAMQRILADIGSYYLLTYYSSNPKLDGRFRRISVRVKREGVDVRARPGYLAPTEAEARAAGVTRPRPPGSRGPAPPPPAVSRALDAIAPARGNLPVRIQAAGGAGIIRAIVELDAATQKQPEWLSGGDLRLVIEPERSAGLGATGGSGGPSYTVSAEMGPGQRSLDLYSPEPALPPGRYSVRAEIRPKGGRAPLQVTTFVTVPAEGAEVGTGAVALRRGPSTGLAYQPTADPRFRRTERLRVEVPVMGEGFTPTARMLTREGQAMPLIVTYSVRMDTARNIRIGTAEVQLAPLAAGEYVLQISLEKNGKTEEVGYGFRLVP